MIADLETVRDDLGALSNINDDNLSRDLEAASAWVAERVSPLLLGDPETQLAIIRLAGRYYKRRLSPEGTSGWQGAGITLTTISKDPDIESLLEHKIDYCKVGLA